jgi:hypothetical protein
MGSVGTKPEPPIPRSRTNRHFLRPSHPERSRGASLPQPSGRRRRPTSIRGGPARGDKPGTRNAKLDTAAPAPPPPLARRMLHPVREPTRNDRNPHISMAPTRRHALLPLVDGGLVEPEGLDDRLDLVGVSEERRRPATVLVLQPRVRLLHPRHCARLVAGMAALRRASPSGRVGSHSHVPPHPLAHQTRRPSLRRHLRVPPGSPVASRAFIPCACPSVALVRRRRRHSHRRKPGHAILHLGHQPMDPWNGRPAWILQTVRQ